MTDPRPFSLNTAHGPLLGELYLDFVETRGIVLLPHGVHGQSHPEEQAAVSAALEKILAAGLGCLSLSLVTEREDHYADSLNNVSLLAQRLVMALESLKLEIDPTRHKLGLLAWGPLTPVALRVTASHDQDITALACFGGLLDLAGLQYLRSLMTPLLFVQPSHDTPGQHSNQRAWPYIDCPKEFFVETAAADIAHCSKALNAALNKAVSHFLCLLL